MIMDYMQCYLDDYPTGMNFKLHYSNDIYAGLCAQGVFDQIV